MLNIFKKKSDEVGLFAPVEGELLPLEKVNDKMFAQRMLGDGFAITPQNEVVCSPCNGKIKMIASTSHAFGILADNGAEILVHVGLDTVNLSGRGFNVLKTVNSRVKAGTPILKLDRNFLNEQNIELTIPVIVTNGSSYQLNCHKTEGKVNDGDEVAIIRRK